MQRPSPIPIDPDLVAEVRRLGDRIASLQRMLEERGKGSDDGFSPESVGRFRQMLLVLTQEPVEDGVNHPAQPLLQAYFAETPRYLPWAEALRGAQPRPSLFADFLRIAGRVEPPDALLRDRLLEEGLASESVDVRDAATQAAELWATASAAEILRRHQEKVPWLADYIERVISDIRLSEVDDRS